MALLCYDAFMSNALDFTYQYAFASRLEASNSNEPIFSLATCNANHEQPHFFDGRVRNPKIMADMLLTLSEIVRSHYFLPIPALLDPVLTSNENLLRLEGFSGCCGVYARVDLPAEFFEGDCHGRGTTNVDFNDPMRRALSRLKEQDEVHFAVGKNEVALSRGNEVTIEKKVKLPLRWIKSFSEVQAYQPRLNLKMEVSGADGLRFIRGLPKNAKPKMPSYIVSAGKSIRLSQRVQKGAVRILGTHRLKALEPLLSRATKLRIWFDDDQGTSGWEVCFPVGSFFLLLSPEIYRGFSGEGQVLSQLATPPSDDVLALVRAQMTWQSEIHVPELAKNLGLAEDAINSALAIFGSQGLAGYDAHKGQYFHRELPFDLSLVEAMQPRLKGARKLLADNGVTCLDPKAGMYAVQSNETVYRVQVSEEKSFCNCPWFSKFQGARGPCKHILAANLFGEET